MAFPNIKSLRNSSVQSCSYFLDANVWIYSLQSFDTLEHWEKKYYDFFYDIIESELDPKPKILLPSLLLSEIINTYLRQIAIPEYKRVNSIPVSVKVDFKKDYRPTTHYKDSFESMMDDIIGFKSHIEFIDDSNITTDTHLFKKNIGSFDFNDYLYYSICRVLNHSKRVVIVTNDGDFQINDIELLTMNRDLLALS